MPSSALSTTSVACAGYCRYESATRWESIAYCATREGLLRQIKDHLQHIHGGDTIIPLVQLIAGHVDPKAWAIIEALPDYYPKAQKALEPQ